MGAKNRQFFFVNGRPVRERTLIAAFNQAFAEHLEKSRSPAGVLFLDLPPADIDVNIHPMKLEIRFRDGRRVFSLVQRALSAGLGGAPRPGALPTEPPAPGFPSGPRFAIAGADAVPMPLFPAAGSDVQPGRSAIRRDGPSSVLPSRCRGGRARPPGMPPRGRKRGTGERAALESGRPCLWGNAGIAYEGTAGREARPAVQAVCGPGAAGCG